MKEEEKIIKNTIKRTKEYDRTPFLPMLVKQVNAKN